jgi:DNA-binding NarL/FixJ family response regulator
MDRPKLLIAVDRRQFSRGCLASWLISLGQEFEISAVADVDNALEADELARASAVILIANAPMGSDAWLQGQIAWIHANRSGVPIVVIAEADELRTAVLLVGRFHLQGYIPITSTMEVAAAALQLVIAGGTYVPHIWNGDRLPMPMPLDRMPDETHSTPAVKLTPREQAVLDLVEQGFANKIIAFRLGMSQSTVKAHVHNIIAKFNVRNRTEAAVTGLKGKLPRHLGHVGRVLSCIGLLSAVLLTSC